jgi:hypothetical protein
MTMSKILFLFFAACLLLGINAQAEGSFGSGGGASTSPSYSTQGEFTMFGGISSDASGLIVLKHGPVNTISSVSFVQFQAAPSQVSEATINQLFGRAQYDDGTFVLLNSVGEEWNVLSGPVRFISDGVLQSSNVYQDTSALLRLAFEGYHADLSLAVKNTGEDDFGIYAQDGANDLWQVQNFGENNLNGKGSADPDGDGQNNLYEYIAGTSPTNASSRFSFSIEPVSGNTNQMRLRLNPRLPDRTYSVDFRVNLTGISRPLTNGIITDLGVDRTIVDPSATNRTRFYRVRIEKP